MIKSELIEAFEYKNGFLYRKKASGGSPAGSIVGWVTLCNGRPYRKMMWKRKTAYVHRVVYLMHNDDYPEVVDHINGNSLDNRPENLRAASQSENMANAKMSKANTSGIKGVIWRKDIEKWAAQIMVNRKHVSLGVYKSIDDAAVAYATGCKKHFGEFGRSEESSNRATMRNVT